MTFFFLINSPLFYFKFNKVEFSKGNYNFIFPRIKINLKLINLFSKFIILFYLYQSIRDKSKKYYFRDSLC